MDLLAWTFTAQELYVGIAAIQSVVLALAFVYARRQVGEAKRTREATIRPFVVIDFEVSHPPAIDLVISNIGPIMATNVQFDFAPPIASSFDQQERPRFAELQMFAKGIEHLPPGKVIRQKFDFATTRWNPDDTPRPGYSDRYEVTLTYESALDGDPRLFTGRTTLDLGIYRYLRIGAENDLRDLSKHAKRIADAVGTWTSHTPHGVRVVTPDDIARWVSEIAPGPRVPEQTDDRPEEAGP